MKSNTADVFSATAAILTLTALLSGCSTAKTGKATTAWGPNGGIYKLEYTTERIGGRSFIRGETFYGPNGTKACELSLDFPIVTYTQYADDGKTITSKTDYTVSHLVHQVRKIESPLWLLPTVSNTLGGIVRVDYHKSPPERPNEAPEATVYFTQDGRRTNVLENVKIGSNEDSIVALLGQPSVVWQDKYFRRTEYLSPTHQYRFQWKIEDPKKLDSIVISVRNE